MQFTSTPHAATTARDLVAQTQTMMMKIVWIKQIDREHYCRDFKFSVT